MKQKSFGLLILSCVYVLALALACDSAAPRPGPYTITFLPNHGEGSIDARTVGYGETCALPSTGFTREWYVLHGWNTSADGSGTAYASGATVDDLGADLTLYAVWELHPDVIKLMDFDDGRSLEELFPVELYKLDGVAAFIDRSHCSIQDVRAKSGSALQKNLADLHRLEVDIDETVGYSDLWVAFDFYIESDDVIDSITLDGKEWLTFPDNTFLPMILLCDKDSLNRSSGKYTKLIGTPLHNRLKNDASGYDTYPFNSIYPVTTIDNWTEEDPELEFGLAIANRQKLDDPMDKWIRLKYHLVLDGIEGSLTLYVDGNLKAELSAKKTIPDRVEFDRLMIWYHALEYPSETIHAPGTNIYLDNIGIFKTDPDEFDY